MSRAPRGAQLLALPPGLDPALPDLVRALDPEEVGRRFERFWPGPPHHGSISDCVLEHVQWSPEVRCVATYRITLGPSGAFPAVTFGVVTAGPEGVRHRLFTADADMPGLTLATDPAVMSCWLTENLGRPIDTCSITPVRYRSGERCVLRYELPGAGGQVLYGKVMAGHRVEDVGSTITSLGDGLVAPLVGVARELQLLVQADAGERSLRSVGYNPPSAEELAETRAGGRLLSRLHARSGPPGRQRSAVEDAGELKQYIAIAERVSPATAVNLAEGIDRLRALADRVGQPAPSHGAFRLDQVHLSAGKPLLIDLDTFCWADPMRDVGNLFAYLTWRGIRRPSSNHTLTEVRQAFLAGYTSGMVAPLDMMRIRAFEGASLLKIAGRCYRRLAVEQWDLVPELVDAALERLDSAGLAGS
jgi:hypothetical protein